MAQAALTASPEQVPEAAICSAKSRRLNSHDAYDNYILDVIIARISTHVINTTWEGLRIQWKKHIKVLLFREKITPITFKC